MNNTEKKSQNRSTNKNKQQQWKRALKRISVVCVDSMKYSFVFILFALGADALETPHLSYAPLPYTDGAWVSRDFEIGIPKFRVEVNSISKKVFVTFLKQNEFTHNSIEITFIRPSGDRFFVELHAMDPLRFPPRFARFVGDLSRAESFIGFEIRIPLYSQRPAVINSRELIEVEE